jgi:hypothetical protein
MNYQMNKYHYPATCKLFGTRLVKFYSHHGAKVHFNYTKIDGEHLRYGVVGHDDLLRDLKYWETLTMATVMLKPISFFIGNEKLTTDQELIES